ncbi:MAG: pentapeptide repeat-containing protein [Candidatus Aminicenantes bacterium]|nr:pentapeptide repeat-containing protein [Candidatus Aminicenantes bacterium]
MGIPQKPYLLKPGTVFSSLAGNEGRYDVMAELLKETVEDRKEKLAGVNLIFARLRRANLNGANLQESRLDRADLRGAWLDMAKLNGANLEGADLKGAWLSRTDLKGAMGLKVEMLLKVLSLYKVEGLDPTLEAELKTKKPDLFEEPDYLEYLEASERILEKAEKKK